jgi:hypothetical protein
MGAVEGEKALHQQHHSKRPKQSLSPAITWLLLLGLLSACQGTEWGERLERAVRPVDLSVPPSAEQPATPRPLSESPSPSAPLPLLP